jgi:long-subunit acyl-CoA synthetase (AMP-forming)
VSHFPGSVPRPPGLAASTLCEAFQITARSQDPALRALRDAAVEEANAQLSRVEQIKRFEILDDAWQPGGDELTPTSKLKRRAILTKYAHFIERLYE